MADDSDGNAKPKDDGGSSWPGFLTELTKSFMILRDVFGYALPGAIFLAIGWFRGNTKLIAMYAKLQPYALPVWFKAVLALGACYTVGHIFGAIAYFPRNTWGVPTTERPSLFKLLAKILPAPKEKKAAEPSTQARLIYLRGSHPEILTEYERQSTMTQLRGATAIALLAAYFVFMRNPATAITPLVACTGVFLLLTFWFSSLRHMDDLANDTVAAGELTDATRLSLDASTYNLEIQNNQGEKTTKLVTLTKVDPNFEIALSEENMSVVKSGTATSTITVKPLECFAAKISLSTSIEGSDGLTATLNPAELQPPDYGQANIKVEATAEAAPGKRTITITATGGGKTNTGTFEVNIKKT
jgi:hypothetical protein